MQTHKVEKIKQRIKELQKEQKRLLKEHGGRSEEYYVIEDTITMLREDLKQLES